MKLYIETCQEGIALFEENEDGTPLVATFEEQYEDHEGTQMFTRFLHYMTEHYGPSDSRYSERRVHINAFPGDKYTGNYPDECPLCYQEIKEDL